MDKQMIEEMAKDIELAGKCTSFNNGKIDLTLFKTSEEIAETLYHLNYRKIPEGAVVLTNEEHKSLIYWEGRFDELIKLATEATRKETAEKFAEGVKAELTGIIPFEDYEIGDWHYEGMEIEIILDEICKEIIGGKDDDTSQAGK